MRIVISVSYALGSQRLFVTDARRGDLRALRGGGNRDVPPGAAGFGRDDRIGVDHDHLRRPGLARGGEGGLEFGDRIDLDRLGAERAGVGGEVDLRQRLVTRVAPAGC